MPSFARREGINLKKNKGFAVIFACCWATYLTAYLCRVNFSSAISALSNDRGLSTDQLGMVGALFYGIYACGQLCNGYIGDRVKGHRFIVLALAGTALCNLGTALSQSLLPLMVCWGLNGCFQSMFWSTIIRLLSQRALPQQRTTISMGISSAMPIAMMVSWSLLGQFLLGRDATYYFLLPMGIALSMIVVWLILGKKYFSGTQMDTVSAQKATFRETMQFLHQEKLHRIVLICVLHGLIKEGVAYWMPLLIQETLELPLLPAGVWVAVLPFANLMGILFMPRLLSKRKDKPLSAMIFVFAAIGLMSAGLILWNAALLIVGCMALISGCCYANNTILMSYIPMQYAGRNMVASVIGVLDFSSYVGAAISTYVLGKLLSGVGFGPLPCIWLGAAIVGALLSIYAMHQGKRTHKGAVSA